MKKRTKRFEFVSKKFYDQSFQVIFKHTERDEMEKKRIGEEKTSSLINC